MRNFVSPHGHVISSMFIFRKTWACYRLCCWYICIWNVCPWGMIGGIILITFIYLAIRIFRVSCCAGLRLWSLKGNPVWPSSQCLISHVFLWRVTILCQSYYLWMLEIKWTWSLLQDVAQLCGEGSVSRAWRRGKTPICFILSKKRVWSTIVGIQWLTYESKWMTNASFRLSSCRWQP